MENTGEIPQTEILSEESPLNYTIKKWKNRLFSNEDLSKGDIIRIILTVILIIAVIYFGISTRCELDCSMCTSTAQKLVQRGY